MKAFVVISVLCALVGDIKTAQTFYSANQNSYQAHSWQQQQQQRGRQAVFSNAKSNYHHNHNHQTPSTGRPQYAPVTQRPSYGAQNSNTRPQQTTVRPPYVPPQSTVRPPYYLSQLSTTQKPAYAPQQPATRPPYAPNVPLITESPYVPQSNYGMAPQGLSSSSKATILKQEYERLPDGGYRFFYETSDGQSREEVGFFRDDPRLGKVLTVHGSYGYIAPNKKKIFVKYVADEKGYRATMSNYPPVHLPSNVINQQLGFLKN